jgi:hypothetical protein
MTPRLVLRIACAGIFIGHGAYALMVNPPWLAFFSVVGIGQDTGRTLMPLIGALDIALALSVLFRPLVPVLAWMTFWALWTALLRPLSGMPIWELVERSGNFGAPLALLLLERAERKRQASS